MHTGNLGTNGAEEGLGPSRRTEQMKVLAADSVEGFCFQFAAMLGYRSLHRLARAIKESSFAKCLLFEFVGVVDRSGVYIVFIKIRG